MYADRTSRLFLEGLVIPVRYTRQYLESRAGDPAVIDEIMSDKSLTGAQRKSALGVVEQLLDSGPRAHADRLRRGRALEMRYGGGHPGTWGPAGAPVIKNVEGVATKGAAGRFAFSEDDLRQLHQATVQRSSWQVKAFESADSLLPAELAPTVLGPVHEGRLLDRLPTLAITAPAYEYVRHNSTTGAAAVTAEGAAKPEIVMNIDQVTATAQKIAAHTAVSYEILSDWSAFVNYVQGELARQLIDVENAELIGGAGTTGHLTGLLHTSGILTHDASTDTGTNVTVLDSVEIAIGAMRVGAALAEPDLFVVHPTTWSAMRRVKDAYGRFLVAPDPTADEANRLWGVDVLVTTQIAAGTGVLIDTTKFGKILVREGISIRTGTNNDDFTRNLHRFVCEERIAPAVERPAALLSITNLPAS